MDSADCFFLLLGSFLILSPVLLVSGGIVGTIRGCRSIVRRKPDPKCLIFGIAALILGAALGYVLSVQLGVPGVLRFHG